jgi:predicted molibdopterin-dependent oxidoreductase YjgC
MSEEHRIERRVDDGLRRGRALEILVDGRPLRAYEGESVAAALLADGLRTLRTTARHGAPRGLYCGIGVCFECVMRIDGRPNVRACQVAVRDGLSVQTQPGEGRWPIARPGQGAGA